MDFYVIPPRKALALSHLGDRYFCLAQQYLKDVEYANFFKSLPSNAWITLDNGAGDHEMVTADQLIQVVKDLKPNEVIPPDELFNGPRTINNLIDFIKLMKDNDLLGGKTEILFCPQGLTMEGWLDCYKYGLENPYVNTIGFSKIGIPYAWYGVKGDVGIMESRHSCFNYLKINRLLEKPIHLLGAGSPLEFEYYAKHDTMNVIRSNDSCNSIWSAVNGLDWSKGQFHRIPTPRDYFDRQILSEDIELIENNVEFMKSLVK